MCRWSCGRPQDEATRLNRELARRSSRLSWAPSGWLLKHPVADISPGTQMLTLGCPAAFCAVRLGFANISSTPFVIKRAIAAPSTTFSDYCNPTGDTKWTSLTFVNEGADSDRIVTTIDAPTEIVVRGNAPDQATGETSAPRWTWTDWVPLSSLPRADAANGVSVLMIRTLLEGNQTLTMPNGTFAAFMGQPELNKGFDYCAGWYPHDAVTTTTDINTHLAHLQVNGTAVACVQFLTHAPGFTGLIAGDSHQQGTSTTTQFANLLFRSILSIGAENIGSTPFGYWSTAFGGATTNQIFLACNRVIKQVKPAFAVLPGWTFNDYSDAGSSDAFAGNSFLSHLIQSASLCRDAGTVPIFLTPFPRDKWNMTGPRVKHWLSLRRTILEMEATGAVVIDATKILGMVTNGQFDGTYGITCVDLHWPFAQGCQKSHHTTQ